MAISKRVLDVLPEDPDPITVVSADGLPDDPKQALAGCIANRALDAPPGDERGLGKANRRNGPASNRGLCSPASVTSIQ